MLSIILNKIKIISFFALLIVFVNIQTSKAEVNYNQMYELNKTLNNEILDLYFLLSIGDMLNIPFNNMENLILDINKNKNDNKELNEYSQNNTIALIFALLANEINNDQCNTYTQHCDTLNILFNHKANEIKKSLESKYNNLGLNMEDLKTLITDKLNRL